jgi:hypothetical protein
MSSANEEPSPVNAYLEVTLAPAFRFFSVWRPVLFDAMVSGRRARLLRRRAVGRACLCAPPHYVKMSATANT